MHKDKAYEEKKLREQGKGPEIKTAAQKKAEREARKAALHKVNTDEEEVEVVMTQKVPQLTMRARDGNFDGVKAIIDDAEKLRDKVHTRDLIIAEKGFMGFTALHRAAENGHLEVCELLIDKGANVNDQTNDGDTALILASASEEDGCLEVVKLLQKLGAVVDKKGFNGRTALIAAAEAGNDKMIDFLVGVGADPTATNDKGKTALTYATNDELLKKRSKLKGDTVAKAEAEAKEKLAGYVTKIKDLIAKSEPPAKDELLGVIENKKDTQIVPALTDPSVFHLEGNIERVEGLEKQIGKGEKVMAVLRNIQEDKEELKSYVADRKRKMERVAAFMADPEKVKERKAIMTFHTESRAAINSNLERLETLETDFGDLNALMKDKKKKGCVIA